MDLLDIALSSLNFLTLKDKILLHNNIDRIEQLVVLSIEDISQMIGRPLGKVEWNGRDTLVKAEKSAIIMERQHIGAVLYGDRSYPALVAEILNPPYCLFYRGNFEPLLKDCVSVVGTRAVCEETARATMEFSSAAALDGVTVVSGNANGIDSFAHRGALSCGMQGATVAVLPCGIDTIVPAGHKALVSHIIQTGGAVISEYIPGCPAEKWRFVQRNRLIAALSPATVVMQAPAGSGALITAAFALDYGRDVMFHKSGFCTEAQKIDQCSLKKLRSANSAKSGRTASAYINAGAPVIADYCEYKEALRDAPGTHSVTNEGQLALFV